MINRPMEWGQEFLKGNESKGLGKCWSSHTPLYVISENPCLFPRALSVLLNLQNCV